ncbi:MFS transporter [Nocardia tengchongensis]|uniref:MFS transporter n=1 Tax=Nocardia tengchongensis TaxID=2055889 RepID=UPI0036B631AF
MTTNSGPAAAPKTLLPLLAVGAFAIGTDTFVVSGVLPSVAESLRISIADAGWISTVFALVYACMAPVLGAVTGRLDRRLVMLISLVGFGLGNIASALAPNMAMLLLARAGTAAAAALFIPAASAVAAVTAAPERRAQAMAVVLGGISVATVAGVPFGTWVAADISWRATFSVVAAIGLLCAALIAVLLPPVALPAAPDLATRLAPVRNPRVAATVLTTFLFLTGGYTALTYVGAVFWEPSNGSGTTLAVLLMVFGIAGVAGTMLAGRGTDRFGAMPVLLASIVILGAVLAALPVAREHLATSVIALALWGLAGMASQPAQQHRLFSISPQAGPLLFSLNSAATFAGIAAGGAIGNRVLQHGGASGVDALGLVGAGIVAVSLVTALVAVRLEAPAESAPAPVAAPAKS